MQSRLGSLGEVCFNTLLGFVISFCMQLFLNSVYEIEMTTNTALQITFLFTMTSIIRSYLVRRIGNYITNRPKKVDVDKLQFFPASSCVKCGAVTFIGLSSVDLKLCADCGHENPWELSEGQKSTLIKGKKYGN